MQGCRVSVFVVFGVLLAGTGCKDQAAPAPAPVAVSPGPPSATEAKNRIPSVMILFSSKGSPDAHPAVRPGTVVTWKRDKPGYQVHFLGVNPCSTSGDIVFVRDDTATAGAKPYVAQCTIAAQVPRGVTFAYRLVKTPPGGYPPIPPGHSTDSATPCKGCYVESDDTP